MTEIHVVMKPISTANGLLPSGAVVDARSWRNLSKLVTQRYLRPATPEEAAKIAVSGEAETIAVDKQPKKVKEKVNA